MKLVIAILLVSISGSAMAQITPGGNPPGSTHTNGAPDYAMGLNNGCTDGMRTPEDAAHYAYQTIMYNPYISTEYKEAYDLGWSQCFGRARDLVNGGISDEAADCLFDGECPEPPDTTEEQE